MKTKHFYALNIFLVACFVGFINTSCNNKEKKDQKSISHQDEKLTTEGCNCFSEWFPHAKTPAPEEGKGSPFDTNETTNCIFHQWSWQKFLWLTKPTKNGKPVFEKQLIQVSDLMIPIKPELGLSLVIKDIEQAGSDGILKSNPQFHSTIHKSDTVYYSIHINKILKDTASYYKKAIIEDKTIPENNSKTFPIGSLELKVSWVKTSAIPKNKLSTYYQTEAAIFENGKYIQSKVALLGMHVVGVVINHPEFIWATFEHRDMAPLYDWKTGTASSADEKLLYGKGSIKSIDGIIWDNEKRPNGPKVPNKAFVLFEYGVPRAKGGDFMDKTSQKEPENYDNIKTINKCVQSNLKDVWKHYFYDGSIWIDTDGLLPQKQADTIRYLANTIRKATKGSIARGSLSLSNLTMETYTQTFKKHVDSINVTNLANCFSCHNSKSFRGDNPQSPLYISHIFEGFLGDAEGKTRDEINALKISEFNRQFLNKE